MLRANIYLLRPTKEAEKELRKICDLSSSLWNEINYIRRQSLFKGQFQWDCRAILDKYSKLLGREIVYSVLKKNNEAWKSYFALIRKMKQNSLPSHFRGVHPPKYWKERDNGKKRLMTVLSGRDYVINGGYLYLLDKLKVKIRGKPRWNGPQGRLEIRYDEAIKKWYAHQSIFVKDTPQIRHYGKRAFIDLGVINIITGWVEGEKRTIAFSGRPILSNWWYWTRKISDLQSKLNKQGLKTSNRLKRMFLKRKRQFRNAINVIVYRFVKYCYLRDVTEIIIGDLTHILSKAKHGRKTNALLHNFWSFKYVVDRLKTTAENFGITIKTISEKGTSSKCIRCGSTNIVRKGRLFVCLDCGLQAHRDTVGVINIASEYLRRPISGVAPHPIVLLFSSVYQHLDPYAKDYKRYLSLLKSN
ncbi:MAG: RNA-guided endonuclease InsQ/TnpB family protein [Candidatus Asgardarchaeia archaeon]